MSLQISVGEETVLAIMERQTFATTAITGRNSVRQEAECAWVANARTFTCTNSVSETTVSSIQASEPGEYLPPTEKKLDKTDH